MCLRKTGPFGKHFFAFFEKDGRISQPSFYAKPSSRAAVATKKQSAMPTPVGMAMAAAVKIKSK